MEFPFGPKRAGSGKASAAIIVLIRCFCVEELAFTSHPRRPMLLFQSEIEVNRLSYLTCSTGNAVRPPMNKSFQPSIYSSLTNRIILLRRLALVRMSASRPSALLIRSGLVKRPANTRPEYDRRKCQARVGLLQLLGFSRFYRRLTPRVPEM